MTFTGRLLSGTFQLALSNGILRLLPVATMPVLTTLLSPQVYGVTTLVGTVISLMSVFALVGIDVSYARAYHSARPPSGARVEHYCWRFAILAAVVTAVFASVGWWFINKDSVELDGCLPILVGLGIIFSVLHTMAQTRARLASRYRAIALTTIATGLIAPVASIVIAVWWRQDAVALLFPMLLSYLIPVLLLGVPPLSRLARPSDLTRDDGAALIKIGLAGIITAPMYWLLSSSDRWFLQHYHGAEAVGVYSIGYSIGIVGMIVNTAVMSVWLPEASREYEQDQERAKATLGRLMSRLIAAMALIWLAVVAAGGDIVRWLANQRFHGSAEFVPFIAASVFFYGTAQISLYGLVLAKQFKWGALWWFSGGVLCILLNFVLVPRFGGMGAAVTQAVSFAFVCLAILITSQAKYPVQLCCHRLATVIVIMLTAGLFCAEPWHTSAPLSLLMKFPFGIAVGSITVWFIAPDWFGNGIAYLHRISAG